MLLLHGIVRGASLKFSFSYTKLRVYANLITNYNRWCMFSPLQYTVCQGARIQLQRYEASSKRKLAAVTNITKYRYLKVS